jgi:hypothetical protein
VFPIVLIQILITGMLLTVGGLCLHTALRSDRQERQSGLLLRTLTRLEQQLRADERESGAVTAASVSEMTFANLSAERGTATWRTDRGFVERIEGDLSSPNSRENYVFPAGYSVEFLSEPGVVVVRIREGSPLVKYREAGSGGLARNAVVVPAAAAFRGGAVGGVIEIRLRGGDGGEQ